VSAYPETPERWSAVARRSVGPFTTHVAFRRPEGDVVEWSSRAHRKRTSLVSRAGSTGVCWAPDRGSWWIGILFAIGSACFLVAPFPGFEQAVGSGADGLVFFVGSIFFTSAATLQWVETINAAPGPATRRRRLRLLAFEPRRIDWWSSGVQVVGTLLFNVDTFHALQTGLSAQGYDRLVWAPDAVGSACFLVSGYLAYVEVCGGLLWARRRSLEWWIAAVNLLGCIAFGISAVAAFWLPSEGSVAHLAAANLFTALGGACFLAGAILLLPESAATARSASARAAA
jgi:hypothetical protein